MSSEINTSTNPDTANTEAGEGGQSAGFEAALAQYNASSELAAERNIKMMIAGVENGTLIKAAQQRASAL